MKLNFKLILLIITLGTLFQFLGHKQKDKKLVIKDSKNPQEQPIFDKKTNSANLPAPKVYTSNSAQNYLGIGKKINSKK
jgi:hypothetical protein